MTSRLLTVALASLLILTGSPPSSDMQARPHSHVGGVSFADLGDVEAKAKRVYEQRDFSGRSDTGSVSTYRASSGRPTPARGASVRLHWTGVIGIEPTMGIAPDGTLFAQGEERGPISLRPIVIRSTDEGKSWKDVSPRVASGDELDHPTTQDPYLHVDRDTGRVFTSDLLVPGPGQMVSYTDDRGKSWSTTVMSVEQTDHQTVFSGPPPKGTAAADGFDSIVYNCAANLLVTAVASTTTTCVKSRDGGDTWALTGSPPYTPSPLAGNGTAGAPGACHGLTGHGHVGVDGTVYLPRGWCDQPWLAISHDEGLTWERVQVSDIGMAAGDSGPPDNIPQPSHESAVVSDRRGNIYYAWVAADLLPYLATSMDGGTTWSKPIPLAPKGVVQSSIPALAIAPKGPVGQVAAAFIGSTDAPGAPYQIEEAAYETSSWNAYMTVTKNALTKDPLLYVATVNDPEKPIVRGKCGTLRCGAQYDFIDVQVGPDGTPWMSAVDSCFGATTCATTGQLFIAQIKGVRLN